MLGRVDAEAEMRSVIREGREELCCGLLQVSNVLEGELIRIMVQDFDGFTCFIFDQKLEPPIQTA